MVEVKVLINPILDSLNFNRSLKRGRDMIQCKNGLSKIEISEVRSIISDLKDNYSDFYLTKNNLRLMILDNLDVLFEGLKKGDKIVWDTCGVAIIVGYSDKSPRKYLKILTKDLKDVESLLKVLFWNSREKEIYIKLKNNNPLKELLLSRSCKRENGRLIYSGFEFVGGRGKETLLRYVAVETSEPTHKTYSKDGDED